MMNFMVVTENGKPICKLSVIAIRSPHTCGSANTPGMTAEIIIVKKMTSARAFAKNSC